MFISHYSGKMNSDMLNRNKTQLKLGLHRLIIVAVIKHRKETECITRTDEKKEKSFMYEVNSRRQTPKHLPFQQLKTQLLLSIIFPFLTHLEDDLKYQLCIFDINLQKKNYVLNFSCCADVNHKQILLFREPGRTEFEPG